MVSQEGIVPAGAAADRAACLGRSWRTNASAASVGAATVRQLDAPRRVAQTCWRPSTGRLTARSRRRGPADVDENRSCRGIDTFLAYVAMTSIDARMLDRELKKGSAELIILSIVEPRARHGYEISKLIETRSAGQLKFHVASLYPLLYRLEERGWLQGRWVEKPGERRRRFYSLTAEGRRVLSRQRDTWKAFVHAMRLITEVDHA